MTPSRGEALAKFPRNGLEEENEGNPIVVSTRTSGEIAAPSGRNDDEGFYPPLSLQPVSTEVGDWFVE